MAKQASDVTIVVPTYNERESLPYLYEGIKEALDDKWEYELIFVDDNSPDGTSEIIKSIADRDERVKLILRSGKLGLGTAVVEGFNKAKGDYLVMMDADLSHRPEDLPGLIEGLQSSDIVIGSRLVPGGGIVNWPKRRILISRIASLVGRIIVGIPVKDLTSGFAAFRREVIVPILPDLKPKGFKLLLEILGRTRGSKCSESPIIFVERRYGKSKFSWKEVVLYLGLCFEMRLKRQPQNR